MGRGEAESSLGVHFRISHRSVECWGRQLLGKTSFSFLMFPLIAVLIYIIIVFVFNAGVYSCFISRRWNSRYVLNFLLPSTFNCSSVQVEGHVYKLMDSIAQSLIKSYQVMRGEYGGSPLLLKALAD